MIENEKQYLITFREARRFEREIHRLKSRLTNLTNERNSEQANLLEVSLAACTSQREDLVKQMDEYDYIHAADRKGHWIATFANHRFWILDPRPEDIDIEDITQGLSRMSRYNGATTGKIGYTVAQHSVLASWLVGRRYRLAVLLHDAAEAYIGDVITPLKVLLGKTYEGIEQGIMGAVAAHFRFSLSDEVMEKIHWADRVMLTTEVRDLVPLQALRFEPREGPIPFRIEPWSQERSKVEFLERFHELTQTAQ